MPKSDQTQEVLSQIEVQTTRIIESMIKFLRRDKGYSSILQIINYLIEKSDSIDQNFEKLKIDGVEVPVPKGILINHVHEKLKQGRIGIPEGECECSITLESIDLTLDRENRDSARVIRKELTMATGEKQPELFNVMQVYTYSSLQSLLTHNQRSPLLRIFFNENDIVCIKDLQDEYTIFEIICYCLTVLHSISWNLNLKLNSFPSDDAMKKRIKAAIDQIEKEKIKKTHLTFKDVSLYLDRFNTELESVENLSEVDFSDLEHYLRTTMQPSEQHFRVLNNESLIPVRSEEIKEACDFFIQNPSELTQLIRNRELDKIPTKLENAFYLYLSQPLSAEETRRIESTPGFMRILDWIANNLNLLKLHNAELDLYQVAFYKIEHYLRTTMQPREQHFRVLNNESFIPVRSEEIKEACGFFIQNPSKLTQCIKNRELHKIPSELENAFYSYLSQPLPEEESNRSESARSYMRILCWIANNINLLKLPNAELNLNQVALNVIDQLKYIDIKSAREARDIRHALKSIFWHIIKQKSSCNSETMSVERLTEKESQGIQCVESMDSDLLFMAAYEGNAQAANLILHSLDEEKRQTCIDQVSCRKTALEIAIDRKNWVVVELLIKNNATICHTKHFKAILDSPIFKNLDAMKWINHLSDNNIDQIKLQINPDAFKKILDENKCLEQAVSANNFNLVCKILNCNPRISRDTFRAILERCVNTNNPSMLQIQILSGLLTKEDCLQLFTDLLMCSSFKSNNTSLHKDCLYFLIKKPNTLSNVLTYLSDKKGQSSICRLLHETPFKESENDTMLSAAMLNCPESVKVILEAITTDKERAELINKEINEGKTAIDYCQNLQSLGYILHYRSMSGFPINMSGERFNTLVSKNNNRTIYREIIGYCLQCQISDLSIVSIERCIQKGIQIPDKVIKGFLDLIENKSESKKQEYRDLLTKYPSILTQAKELGLNINNESSVWFSSAVKSGNIESLKIIVESLVNKDEIKSFINKPIADGKTMLDQAVSLRKYDLAEYLLTFEPSIKAEQFELLLNHNERKLENYCNGGQLFDEFLNKSLSCEFVGITSDSIRRLKYLLKNIPEKLIGVFIRPLIEDHDPTKDIDRKMIINMLISDHLLLQTAMNHKHDLLQLSLLKESPRDTSDTWLSFACFNRKQKLVEIILSNIPDIKLRQELLNQKTHEGKTALEWALCKTERQINWEIISILLDSNPDINVKSFSTILEDGTDDIIEKCLKTNSGNELATQFLTKAQNQTFTARWFSSVFSPAQRNICAKIRKNNVESSVLSNLESVTGSTPLTFELPHDKKSLYS